MKSHARVVIIGGGVAGTSALYHFTQRGWSDCLLLEMDELTSGSTWHAAGNVPTFSGSRNMIRLQHYSTELYRRLCTDPEYPINYHQSGSIRLAQTRQRMEEYQHVIAMAKALDLDYELLDVSGIRARHPFLETHALKGALWDPCDGDIDPSQLTQALASHARRAGATVQRFTRVTALSRTQSGEWSVQTDKGEVTAEFVINAGGYRAAEVSALAGQFQPVVSLEHQYLVTESIPELAGRKGSLPLVRDPDDSYYLRQEKSGLILGPYEKEQARLRWQDGRIPEHFAYELFPDDLARLELYIEMACARMPLLGSVGVQRVINGPIPYTPDGLPYIGPAFGLPGFFHINTFSFGICQGGGAGKCIAEWVIDGKPEWDMWSTDPRRYTAYADQAYVAERALELYQHEYAIGFPVEERPAGRPRYMTPVYERLQAGGAHFGARGGWERATWFDDQRTMSRQGVDEQSTDQQGVDLQGTDEETAPSYQRGPWFNAVGRECLHVRDRVGVLDLGGFTRIEVKGKGATEWLDSLIAGSLPRTGRMTLAYSCADDGGIWSEMTLNRLAGEQYLLISAAAARWHDLQWLSERVPADSDIQLTDTSDRYGTLVVAGPRSRALLQPLTETDLSNDAFPWLSSQYLQVAGIDVLALRVNYVGELGWELHVSLDDQLALYDALFAAGKSVDLKDFGVYAMESMRLEKSYRAWKVELDHQISPLCAGLSRFVDFSKPHFKGRSALLAQSSQELPEVFVTLLLDPWPTDQVPDQDQVQDQVSPQATARTTAQIIAATDALYGCPIQVDDSNVGYTTSGGYGHRIGRSIALGYVKPAHAMPGTRVTVRVLGQLRTASVVAESPYDPGNTALRS